MSSWPGPTLEDFVEDAFFFDTKEQVATMAAILEPWREVIERRMVCYDEEEHGSWRDYRNWTILPVDAEAAIDKALSPASEEDDG